MILNSNYLRGIWQFYCCYNLSLSVLEIKESRSRTLKRNILWKKFFMNQVMDEKKFKKFRIMIQEDMEIVIKALNFIDKQTEQMAYEIGDIDKPDYIAILAYEFPA